MRPVALVLLALVLAAPAWASEGNPSLSELEGEVMCPVCGTTLDQSNSPIALRIERFIQERIRAGDTKSKIKRTLVAEFGPRILAAPPRRGFDLLAWWVPLAGILGAAALVGAGAWRWSRRRDPDPPPGGRDGLDPLLERRLDDELARFDS